jgi:hypothetical protein
LRRDETNRRQASNLQTTDREGGRNGNPLLSDKDGGNENDSRDHCHGI